MRSGLLSIFIFSLLATSCNNKKPVNGPAVDTSATTDTASQQNEPGMQVPDTLGAKPAEAAAPDNSPLKEGKHDFTLHWISWERPGSVDVKKKGDGSYEVKGSQRDNRGNFATIDGTLEVIDPLKLRFEGLILTKSETVNNNDTCKREGEQIFLSTKGRKYWRLQNMENCERGNVVDYIDIYF